jgi:HTH-type transcriptional regulator/antitoxin HigA
MLPGTYFKMVRQFPLTHIRDDDHLGAAQEVIDRLLQEDLDALTDLVETYENERLLIPGASEAEVLAELLRSHGLSQAKLAKAVGISQSTLSAVVNGTRSLTKEQVVALARFFQVSPAAFLPA